MNLPDLVFIIHDYRDKFLLSLLRKADLNLTLSQFEKKLLEKQNIKSNFLGGFIDSKVARAKKSKKKEKENFILYLGTQSAHKKIEVLIEAACLANIKLVIAGPKTLYSPVIEKKIQ